MAMTDPIADMLTRVRNAGRVKFNSVDVPASKIKIELAKVMKTEGYIRNYKFIKDSKQGILKIYLKYTDTREHVIQEIKRVSKPSRRGYVGANEIESVFSGMGVAVLSTSRGIISDRQARKLQVGGEVICNIF